MKTRHPKSSLASQLRLVARGISNLSPMSESLETTRYIPTIFPSFNRAIVVGGAPLRCVWTIFGTYGGGKSTLAVGIAISFAQLGHLAVIIDSEHTSSKTWFQQLGADPESILFYQPDFLEDAANTIDTVISNFDQEKKNGRLEQDKGLAIIVDTINKLTPKNEWKRFQKEGAEALDKGLARTRGLLLQSWLDHMTPTIGKRDVALICIAQEREVQQTDEWKPDFKIKGCQGLAYDSSVQIRVIKGKSLWTEGKKKYRYGQEHKMIVFKNKVSFPHEMGKFYTSNGKGDIPIGFDHALTAITEADECRNGIITKSGSWLYYAGNKWQGKEAMLKDMRNDPGLLSQLQRDLNEEVWEKSKSIISEESSDDEIAK